jgi:hypothetical protein
MGPKLRLLVLTVWAGCGGTPGPTPAVDGAASPDGAVDAAAIADGALDGPADTADGATALRLFNGSDLAGWIWVSADPAVAREAVFSVVDGNLRCKGTPNGYLRTEASFTSFVLTLQVRHLTAGNGGVFLRVQSPDKVWPKAIEAQGQSGMLGDLLVLDGFPLEPDATRTQGILTTRLRPDLAERSLGEWNDYRITLAGEELTIEVNGAIQNQARRCAPLPGAIALQSEGAEYEFRDIVLRPLD